MFLFSTVSIMQTKDNFGVKIGVSNSYIYSKYELGNFTFHDADGNIMKFLGESNSNWFLSPTFNIWYKYSFNDYFSVEPTIGLLKSGGQFGANIRSSTSIYAYNSLNEFYTDYDSLKMYPKLTEPLNSKTFTYLTASMNTNIGYTLNAVKPYLIMGLNFQYLLDGDYFIEYTHRKIKIGYNLGLGIELREYLRNTVYLEFTYSSDFTSFAKSKDTQMFNRSFLILLGFSL